MARGQAGKKAIRVAFLYQKSTEKVDWIDRFPMMMDAASFYTTKLLLLGDFNVDLTKPQNSRIGEMSTYNLLQLIDTPTRISSTAKTLIEHIYATDKLNIYEPCIPVYGCSDLLTICLTWNKKA